VKGVIDTNVLVAGLLNPSGLPARVLDLVARGDLTPVVDDRILAEYRAVLLRPRFGIAPGERKAVLEMFEGMAQQISAPPLGLRLPDSEDACFIEVAVEAMSDFLITGNKKHFPARSLGRLARSILIVTPREFISRVGAL